MKQPVLGIVATGIVMVVSWVVVWLLGVDLFMGWASFALMGAIPFAITVGAFWQGSQPAAVARLAQPGRGVAFLALAAAVAAAVTALHWVGRGGGLSPPPPMAVMTIITSVVVMFFLAIVWGGWPFSLISNRLAAGITLLVAAYAINALIFQLFDFGFAQGAPFYRPELDPGGPIDAWSVVVVMVTALSVMFLFLHFDVWPLSSVAALREQPLLGIAWTVCCFAISLLVFWWGTSVAALPAPTFMVTVSIPFLFGSIVVLQMLGGSLFPRLAQPIRGLASAVVAAVVGVLLSMLYAALMPVLSGPLPSGPEGNFAAELWLANSMLAVTFPLLAFYGDFFGLWPLAGRTAK